MRIRESIKTSLTVPLLVLAMLLTACSAEDDTAEITTPNQSNIVIDNTTTELQTKISDILETENTDSEKTNESSNIQTAFDDYFIFPDGSRVEKGEAVISNADIMGFNFAIMRYAQPVYWDTDTNSDLYDFENFEYNISPCIKIENIEYIKILTGQTLENGLTVSEASCMAYDAGGVCRVGAVDFSLDGSITMDGILYCAEDDEYIDAQGDVIFYPNPTQSDYIPMPYEADTALTFSGLDLNSKFAFICDGGPFRLGNINDMNTDISDYFENGHYVKVKAELTGIKVRYDESRGGILTKAVLADVELS